MVQYQHGVKQGCNMSGFLFVLVIDWIMKNTVGNGENGIRWKFMSKLDDLDFADDIAVLSSTQQHLQQKTDNLVLLSHRTGLRVNPEKCKTLRIYEKCIDKIRVDNATLEDVETFHYLGAVVSKIGGGSKDLQNRLTKARSTFCRLRKLWSSTSVSQHTKIKLYKTLVMPVLLYGCETWSMTKGDENKIDVFQSRCLRQILRVKWRDRITNSKVLETARMETISGIIRKRRWKYIGHIPRKEADSDCITALTWAPEGKRRQGRPKTTWRRMVEKERMTTGWRSWQHARTIALNRE
ncbi:LINE-1 reverse transcriptase-like protein [Elysia marginata]|uniref:LINE-1 reverse transcriptase-like protein n=1 Tax=Elysia marginata TaxID=1093978 RepID=A0AAV4HWP0_9GAST|nr:LINE-1 reverse transcriptase-like protein [Elysia marginata]